MEFATIADAKRNALVAQATSHQAYRAQAEAEQQRYDTLGVEFARPRLAFGRLLVHDYAVAWMQARCSMQRTGTKP